MDKSSPFPQLTTNRLALRQLSLKDEEQIYLLRSNDAVNKYLDRPKARSIEDAREFIKRINFGVDNKQSMFWAVCFADDSKLIGTICLWNFSDDNTKAEIGYELLPQYQGKGIMQEAFSKVVEFAFADLHLNTIEAWTVQQNKSSIGILERNHFKRDSELENKIDRKTESPDLIIYVLSKNSSLHGRT